MTQLHIQRMGQLQTPLPIHQHITFCNLNECVLWTCWDLKKKSLHWLYWDGWWRKCVRTSFLCRDHVTHTHTVIWIYVFVVSGSELFPTIYNRLLCFSQSFLYSWVFVVSAALGGTRVTGAPQKRQEVFSTAEFALWERVTNELTVHI